MAEHPRRSGEEDYRRFTENFLTNFGDTISSEDDFNKAFDEYLGFKRTAGQDKVMRRKVLRETKRRIDIKEPRQRKTFGFVRGKRVEAKEVTYRSKKNKVIVRRLRDEKGRFISRVSKDVQQHNKDSD